MRHSVRFLLDGRVEEVSDCGPTDTVLDYLRERKLKVGTKEGCAEGDCGACTVVLAELSGDRLAYRAVNACILFLAAIDGKQLITVESLRQPDNTLHPVQQAMVDQHGSQCGFCTPGFIMSLFSLFHRDEHRAPERREINEALAGNLCRCTGYLPILRAAEQALKPGRRDAFTEAENEVAETLRDWSAGETLSLKQADRRSLAPTSLRELCALLDEWPRATLVAGATDVGLWVTKQLRDIDTIVHTGHVKELKRIVRDEESGVLEIGAAVTYTEAMPVILDTWPGFGEVMTRLGALQVRNAGTVGGNIANGSPIADMPPGLIVLGARLVLASSAGEREIELEDFYIEYGRQDLRPGECVAAIRVPLPADDLMFGSYKLSRRIEQDISSVCGAYALSVEGGLIARARVCYGGMAGVPARARQCEKALTGRPWSADTVEAAMHAMENDFQPITDMRAGAGYRMEAAQNLLKRFYLERTSPGYPVRLENRFDDSSRGALT